MEVEVDKFVYEIFKDLVFIIGVVVNQERKVGQIQQVCVGQVQYDDGVVFLGSYFENVSGNCYSVFWKVYQEDDVVNNREVVFFERDFFISVVFKSSCIIGEMRSICNIVQWFIYGGFFLFCKNLREFSLVVELIEK